MMLIVVFCCSAFRFIEPFVCFYHSVLDYMYYTVMFDRIGRGSLYGPHIHVFLI